MITITYLQSHPHSQLTGSHSLKLSQSHNNMWHSRVSWNNCTIFTSYNAQLNGQTRLLLYLFMFFILLFIFSVSLHHKTQLYMETKLLLYMWMNIIFYIYYYSYFLVHYIIRVKQTNETITVSVYWNVWHADSYLLIIINDNIIII